METILPEYYQTFKEDPQLILLKVFKNTETEDALPIFFCETYFTQLSKPNKDTWNRKEEIKGLQIEKGGKLSLFADEILNIRQPKNSTRKLLPWSTISTNGNI